MSVFFRGPAKRWMGVLGTDLARRLEIRGQALWGDVFFEETGLKKCLLRFWGQTLRNAVFSMGTGPSKVGAANNFWEICKDSFTIFLQLFYNLFTSP